MRTTQAQCPDPQAPACSLRPSPAAVAVTYALGLVLALALELFYQWPIFEAAWRGEGTFPVGYFIDSTLWTLMLLALPGFWLARPFCDLLYALGRRLLGLVGWLGRSDAAFGVVAFALPVLIGLAVRVQYFAPYAPEDIYIHDEASYLFQANTYLAGRLWFPSPPCAEHFDWFHIVNQGKMASRYFPGTGLFLVPFVLAGVPWLGYVLGGGVVGLEVFLIGLELGDRRAARLGALLCALSPAVLTFSQILEAHIPTTIWLLLGVFGFLRTLRRDSLANPVLAGAGLGMALLTRPLTAFGVAALPATWLIVRVMRGRVSRGPAKLSAMAAPMLVSLGLLGACNAALTGNVLYPPYLLYTDTYSPRHRYGFYNVTRAKAEEEAARTKGCKAFPRRDLQRKFVEYDRWADDVRPLPDAWYRFHDWPWLDLWSPGVGPEPPTFAEGLIEPAVPIKKLRMRLTGMWRGTLGTVAGAMALLLIVLSWNRLSRADRLVLSGIVGLHAIHFPFAFEGIDWVGYVFESVPLFCVLVGRATVGLAHAAIDRGRGWLVVWLAAGLAGMAAENFAAWLPNRFEEIAVTREHYRGFRVLLTDAGVTDNALVFVAPGQRDLHRSLVFNIQGPDAPVLRAWHISPFHDLRCAMAFRERRCYLLDEDTRRLHPIFERRPHANH